MKRKEERSFVLRLIIGLIVLFVIICSIGIFRQSSIVEENRYCSDISLVEKIIDEYTIHQKLLPDSGEMDPILLNAMINCHLNYNRSSAHYIGTEKSRTLLLRNAEKQPNENNSEFIELVSVKFDHTMLVGECSTDQNKFNTDAVIVFGKVCTKDQINMIENCFKGTNPYNLRVEDAEGYLYGRFFYPTKVTLKSGKKSVKIETDYKDDNNKVVFADFMDPTLFFSDGTMLGDELSTSTSLNDQEIVDTVNPFDSESILLNTFNLWSNEKSEIITIHISNEYSALICIENNYWWHTVRPLLPTYLLYALVILLLGLVLINEYKHTIGFKLQNEQHRRNLMDSLAHEMKTPLAVIRNYGEVLLEETNEEKHDRFLRTIINETEDLNNAIINVLDLSKMEAGTYSMELSSVSMGELLNKVLERKQLFIDRKSLILDVIVEEKQRIFVDEKLVFSTISNFIDNAIVHTPEKGKVEVRLTCHNNQAYITVRNQGKQLSDVELNKVWDSFYGNKKVNKESTGLGLAIAKNACQLHDGGYGCKNEEDGVTFWAEFKSMDNKLHVLEKKTRHVFSSGDSVYGTRLICTGYLVQMGLLFLRTFIDTITNSAYCCTYINDTIYYYSTYKTIFAVVFFACSVVILFGIYDLYKKSCLKFSYVIPSAVSAICVIALLIISSDWAILTITIIGTVAMFIFVDIIFKQLINRCSQNDIDNKELRGFRVIYIVHACMYLAFLAFNLIETIIGTKGFYIYFLEALQVNVLDIGYGPYVYIPFVIISLLTGICWWKYYKLLEGESYEIKSFNGLNIVAIGFFLMALGLISPSFSLNHIQPMFVGICWVPSGATIILVGLYLLYQEKVIGKKILILAILQLFISIILYIYGIYLFTKWGATGDMYSAIFYNFFPVVGWLFYITNSIICISIFIKCINSAKENHSHGLQKLFSRCMYVFIITYLFAGMWQGNFFMDMFGLYTPTAPLFIIPYAICAFAWIKAYKKIR